MNFSDGVGNRRILTLNLNFKNFTITLKVLQASRTSSGDTSSKPRALNQSNNEIMLSMLFNNGWKQKNR